MRRCSEDLWRSCEGRTAKSRQVCFAPVSGRLYAVARGPHASSAAAYSFALHGHAIYIFLNPQYKLRCDEPICQDFVTSRFHNLPKYTNTKTILLYDCTFHLHYEQCIRIVFCRNGQLYCGTDYNNTAYKSSQLFNPLMHISNNHSYNQYNSEMYGEMQIKEESLQSDVATDSSLQQADGLSQHSFTNDMSPVCYTDDTSINSSTSLTESIKTVDKVETKKKLTAKERKELAEIQKRNSLTADGKYECSLCKQQFETNFKLQYHRKSAHEERKFKCDICFKAFLTSHHLKMHSAIHVEIKPFGCNQCSASFRYKKLLERHIASYHIPITDPQPLVIDTSQPFACSQCELRFATRNSYNHHTKSHKSDNIKTSRFPCDICGKELSTRESLESHRVTHGNDKNLVCDICNKVFSHKKYLQVHQRIHSGLKPYVCATCGKSFTQASTLTVHRRYHSGERPYTCHVCNKGFVTRTIMLTHLKKHP